ncbi:315L [Invertebrate iridescent virus Kaz2018]|uniref:Putative KilA-N domain-containing protein 315L n=1 Tax=Invertebrate iridescent virus 6 TaxID=176652 RepID=315L_IIV6|nr:315L [Invertebrate iridescent virus 6]Q91FK9.1 RecName: Full=Putative KilA-N domain-containing protein 315L [Invertebrate iridescent virus 6]AAK82176.1 315L [Invertebrate iridescent virus 6]QNH08725.1 315L [Invertebrate iridescent virus Kaz2018]
MASLNDICYEKIKDNFYYGLFRDFKLVVDKNTECFNATKLCNSGGKQFRQWTRLEKSKKLMEYYSRRGSQQMYEIKGDNKDQLVTQTTGTYAPIDFFEDIKRWIQLPKASSASGVVYVVTTSILQVHNVFKIGYTKNFEERLKTFNDYRHSLEPQFFAVAIYDTDNAKKLETTIHKKLKDFRSEGEFFQVELSVIKEAFLKEDCCLKDLDYEEDHSNSFTDLNDKLKTLNII